jgi:hypothetical protein
MRPDVVVLCRRLPPSPPEGWDNHDLCGVAVTELTGPSIEEALGRELPFRAAKALLFRGTFKHDWDLVLGSLEPLVDAVDGELWTDDGRVLYRGRGPRLSFEELRQTWRSIARAHAVERDAVRHRSHVRFKAIAAIDPDGVRAANDWSDVLPDDLELA